jgi:hypothetical protein
VSSLHSCVPLAYSDNERAKQLLYVLDDSVCGMKITALEKFTDFATLDTEKLFSKLKSHELSRKRHPNHDASLTSKIFITSARVGGHDANPTNITVSSALEFILSYLATAFDEQYESIPDDEIILLARKFRSLHKFCKERRRSPRGCFECGDITHSSPTAPRRRSSTPPSSTTIVTGTTLVTSTTTPSGMTTAKAMTRRSTTSGTRRRRRSSRKIMSRACTALSDFDFSSDDSSSSEEDEKIKRKPGDFTGLCLMGKSSRNIPDFDSDVSDNLSPESLSLRVTELESALYNQYKLFCKVFRENKKLKLELESSSFEIASLRSVHDDMSDKPCENNTMIMINYANLWILHSQVARLLDGARLELREPKAHSLLLGACTSCPLLRSDLEACAIEIKDLKHKHEHPSRCSVLSPPCELCGSLKGKLFRATKENTELKQEVTYLTACLEKTVLSEKMVDDDLSRVEKSATKSTYKLGIGFERCEDKGEKNASKFISSSNYHQEEKTIKSTNAHYPANPKLSFNPKREVRKENPKPREETFVCMFCGRASHLDGFCF